MFTRTSGICTQPSLTAQMWQASLLTSALARTSQCIRLPAHSFKPLSAVMQQPPHASGVPHMQWPSPKQWPGQPSSAWHAEAAAHGTQQAARAMAGCSRSSWPCSVAMHQWVSPLQLRSFAAAAGKTELSFCSTCLLTASYSAVHTAARLKH